MWARTDPGQRYRARAFAVGAGNHATDLDVTPPNAFRHLAVKIPGAPVQIAGGLFVTALSRHTPATHDRGASRRGLPDHRREVARYRWEPPLARQDQPAAAGTSGSARPVCWSMINTSTVSNRSREWV